MKIKDSVFGSGPERLLFKALQSAWPGRITVYHNLPILNVIDISGARISQTEREYLKKASVDYTACDAKTDRPLLSVEFDGLGHGYSKETHYVELVGGADPYRRDKMELKLRIANEVGYPFFVVSYDEAAPIAGSDQLTIAHAIVGKCLANMKLGPLVEQRIVDDDIHRFPPWERDEIIQDMVTSAEVELDFEWNPLAHEAARAIHAAQENGAEGYTREHLTDPELPELRSSWDTAAMLLRAKAIRNARRIGCRVTLRVRDSDEAITGEAWVRNISGHGFSPFGIVEELAELVAARKFLVRRRG